MSKKVAIVQSNYIPWKGYFDIIAYVDEFIIFDEVQFTKRDWRNRNKIKTPQDLLWLTVPVLTKSNFLQKISQTKINGDAWKKKHWNALRVNYHKSKFFDEISGLLKDFYHAREFEFLSHANRYLIDLICDFLDIPTRISSSADLNLPKEKNQRLISICKQVKADVYLSGRSAQGYIDLDEFSNAGISIEWFDYDDYPEYDQLWGKFVHEVSILDLLFNCGKSSKSFMKYSLQ
ncbi:MAG: WbqC family protein [Opitutales bacterium]|nr:WbqC family protein [Opitutales bacterium]